LNEHFGSEQIEKLLAGKLSRRATRAVVAHLLEGCGNCSAAFYPAPVPEQAYDPAISAAFTVVHGWVREIEEAKRWLERYLSGGRRLRFQELSHYRKKQLSTWGFCEVLLRASQGLRRDYPDVMVDLAEIAVEASGLVPLAPFGLRRLRDLEARAWGELANAYRVADDLPRSEAALGKAFERFNVGTRDPLLLARLHDLSGSLFISQRRFTEAARALEEAYSLFIRAGDQHAGGKVLISVGILLFYSGSINAARLRLYQGLKQVDRNRDSDLVFRALHNLLHTTVALEDFKSAWLLIKEMRPLYVVRSGRIDQTRLKWTEGRLAVALGSFAEAEVALQQAKQEFERAGLFYHGAGAGLDLAAVWYRQGKTGQVKAIVGELVATFGRVGVKREALAALIVLQKALDQERATLEMIETTCAAVQRFAGERR
jgi:tetratricopeptide (TPR) repeat protein